MDQPADPIRVILADDHRLVRCALAQLIDSLPGMTVVAEAADGDELLTLARELAADVVLADAAMPGVNGLEAARRLRTVSPDLHVLLVSMYDSEEFVARALENGACGFIRKDASVEELQAALRRAASGERVVPAVRGADAPAGMAPPGSLGLESLPLTRRQQEVLQLIVDGCRNKDIAERLDVSIKTVETHRAEIMRRMGVRRTADLVRKALQLNLRPQTS